MVALVMCGGSAVRRAALHAPSTAIVNYGYQENALVPLGVGGTGREQHGAALINSL